MKQFMKKWSALLLALLLTLSLTACGGVDEETVQLGLEVLDAVLTEVEEQEKEGQEAASKAPAPEEAPREMEQEAAEPIQPDVLPDAPEELLTLPEDGSYTSKDDVALYIYLYGGLPDNFMTKKEARALGWPGGSLEPYAPGMCIGGDHFGNYEGLLPEDRSYTECDIDTLGADSRGAKRIVFSDDGLIYYTEDHYESFELLYGEE